MLAVRTSRFRLLLAVLLMLLAVSAPAVVGDRHPGSAFGASVSATPSGYDELHDRPRGPVTAGHGSTRAAPDTWSVVYQEATSERAPRRRSPADEVRNAVTPATAQTPPSSRAPPHA